MKLNILSFLLLLLASVVASLNPDIKGFLVSFDRETPAAVIDKVYNFLVDSGATINHKYTLVKAFSVSATQEIMDSFEVLTQDIDSKYKVTIEPDQEVHIFSGGN